ncbi:MAG: ABC transporter substrate-binding protein [Tissierellia bacterium]|nr:ABC transporter substrate-binding protein [Tissierellia bacterium]
MKRIRKILVLLLILGLTSCNTAVKEKEESTQVEDQEIEEQQGQEEQEVSDESEKEEIEITDQNDRKVKVKVPVERIVCLQHHSFDILTQLGVEDKIVATEDKLEGNLGDYITDLVPEVKDMPRAGTLAEPNVEMVAEQKPDLVLVAAQANPDAIAQLEELGIPTLVITLRGEGAQEEAQNPRLSDADSAYTEGLKWVVETFGKLTNTEERAEKLWNFCMESRAMVDENVDEIPDDERVRVFIANEEDQTYGDDKYVGVQLLRAGAVNVASKDIQGYKPYNMEQLAAWNPDVIIVQDRYPEVYERIISDPQYEALKAVQEGKVIVAPYWTKPWGNPDTDSVALGELWLAHQFYPEKIDRETVEKRAKEFYQEFYNAEFTGQVE